MPDAIAASASRPAPRRSPLCILSALLFGLVSLADAAPFPAATDDAPPWSDVRTVLEARCLECHGRDAAKSGLAFATRDTFERGGVRGALLDRAQLENSRLLEVIGYENPELAMPPTGKLPPEEIATLERWILAGAPWPKGNRGKLADPDRFHEEAGSRAKPTDDWWAYRTLHRPSVPRVEDKAWSRHPIDRFIRDRLDDAGLTPAEPASPLTLLRRATFGLTGLPPEPEQIDAFLREAADDGLDAAYATLVDRLLESPNYGEHWGRHWLDLVRYAETNGYERDATKQNVWRYRDWVIRSLNEDKPYDRFVLEQLAGDELADQLGSSDDPNAPIRGEQADALLATGYYRLGVWDDEPSDPKQALADELADIVDTTGQVFLGTTVGCARCHDHKADPLTQREYYALTAYFNNVTGYGGGGFGQHLGGGRTRDLPDRPGDGVLTPEDRENRLARVEGELAKAARAFETTAPSDDAIERKTLVADARGPAPPAKWRHRFAAPARPDGWERSGFNDSKWALAPGGFGRKGTPGSIIGTLWTTELIHLRTRFRLTRIPKAAVLSVHHDEDFAVYLNGQLIEERKGYRSDYTEIPLDADDLNAFVVGRNVLAVVCRQTGGGQYIDIGLRTGETDAATADWIGRLAAAVHARPDRDGADRVQELLAERAAVLAAPLTSPYPALVVSERGPSAPAQHVLQRGIVHAPGETVEPGVPAAFRIASKSRGRGPAPPKTRAKSTGRRTAFAQWLVGDGAFLTARVMANRLWQFHFGRGLCRSPGDFGRLGVEPTHPDLLDHLACELIQRDWSLKSMHRYLMTSRAYRMASIGSAEARAQDPRNDLYWRFDPRRLSAEEFRDSVLSVSGQLTDRLYGPSVYPPMAPEVLATSSRPGAAWGKSDEADAARRSVYVFVKRSLRMPLLESLDQPDPDLPCPERFLTNVPTQALITLNGDFVQDAATKLSERLTREARDLSARIDRGIRLAFGRPPHAGEVARHAEFVRDLRNEHGLDASAALRLFCVALFNQNEFLWTD